MKTYTILILVVPPAIQPQHKTHERKLLLTFALVLQRTLAGEFNVTEAGAAKPVGLDFSGMGNTKDFLLDLETGNNRIEAQKFGNIRHRVNYNDSVTKFKLDGPATFELKSLDSQEVIFIEIGIEKPENKLEFVYTIRA